MLDGGATFIVYWTQNELDPVNPKLSDKIGLSFRGRLLVFRKKKWGARLVNLRKGDDIIILKAVSW